MSIKYLVKEELIPDDGSKEIIENFYNKTEDKTLDLLVYPDVHYKKGARVVNGMLTASDNMIYPSISNSSLAIPASKNSIYSHFQLFFRLFRK